MGSPKAVVKVTACGRGLNGPIEKRQRQIILSLRLGPPPIVWLSDWQLKVAYLNVFVQKCVESGMPRQALKSASARAECLGGSSCVSAFAT